MKIWLPDILYARVQEQSKALNKTPEEMIVERLAHSLGLEGIPLDDAIVWGKNGKEKKDDNDKI